MKSRKLLALAVPLLAAGLGTTGNANANAYAFSYNGLTQGTVDVWQQVAGGAAGDACSLINSGIGGVADCAIGTVVTNFATPGNNTSDSRATLTGDPGAADSDVGLGLQNADESTTGSGGLGNDTYSAKGQVNASYTRGDSQLISEQAGTNNFVPASNPPVTNANPGITITSLIEAKDIAEGYVDQNNSGAAGGKVNSASDAVINLELTTPGQIAFSFDYDPYMFVEITDPAEFGSKAEANVNFTVTIEEKGTDTQIFSWSPNGLVTAIIGGQEVSDPFNLNRGLTQLNDVNSKEYDPTGDGIGGAVGTFTAYTNTIAAGEYTLKIQQENSISVINAQAIPEPSAIALMGLGMLGFGFAGRLRSKKKA